MAVITMMMMIMVAVMMIVPDAVMVPVSMLMVMMVVMPMCVSLLMIMMITMPMLMMMDALVRTAAARVLAEHERLDGHRHRVGRQPDFAEIDIVEIPQHHAVDGQDF